MLTRMSEENILIGLTGDVMIGRLVERSLNQTTHPECLWGDVLPVLRSTDLNLVNLEAALTNSEKKAPKTFNFKAKPERVEVLKLASIGVCNLANNHCLDFGEEGLLETLDVLDRAGISHTGAGRSLREALEPVIQEVRGIAIGIVGFTDNEPSWVAKEASPGVNYVDISQEGLNKVQEAIGALKQKSDLVLLTMHWGPNMRESPPLYFQEFARAAIDCGVDIFHGHSAHIFQGVETYGGRLILYDTGDFVDDYYVDPLLRNDRSFFFVVEAGKNGLKGLQLIPTRIENCQVNLSTGEDKEETMKRMEELSERFHTSLIRTGQGLSIKLEKCP